MGGFTKPAFITKQRDEKESNYFEGFSFFFKLIYHRTIMYLTAKQLVLPEVGSSPELSKPHSMISLHFPICP